MTQEVQRLDNVVGDLLELARPDKLNLSMISPSLLLERAVNLVRADMDKIGIQYDQEVPEVCPEVLLDADRMTQVLLNLLLNAIQAMPGGGRLTAPCPFPFPFRRRCGGLRVWRHTAAGYRGYRRRNSQGQDSADLQPYYTTKARGTGLGLSLVQKIIEAHDGEIEVVSTPGKGTRFTLHLPLRSPAQEEGK